MRRCSEKTSAVPGSCSISSGSMLVGSLPDSKLPNVTETEQILRDFGLIVEAGLVSQAIAVLLRLSDMMVLVAVGALIGPSVLGAR